jgi:ACS family tartrate transporter-like MFS transporter
VFILEGIAPILAGVATLFLLPDRPATAKWLPADERDWLLAELEQEKRARASHGHWDWLRDRRNLLVIVLLTVVYFSLNFASYGLGSFMPTIIKRQAHTSNNLLASCLAALPYVMALIAMQINGRHSDRTGERLWHAGVPLTMWGFGLLVAWQVNDLPIVPVVVMIVLVGPFLYAHLPAFWPLPTMFLGATTAASAIGFINMLGNIGGFFGSNTVGEMAAQHQYAKALLILAPGPLLAATIILMVGYVRRRQKG